MVETLSATALAGGLSWAGEGDPPEGIPARWERDS